MSSRHPKQWLRGLVLALTVLLAGLGPPDAALWASWPPSAPSSQDPGPELWRWLLLLAGGGWLLGYVGGRLARKTDSTRSPLSPRYGFTPPGRSARASRELARLPMDQLYRELQRVNQAALARTTPGDTTSPRT